MNKLWRRAILANLLVGALVFVGLVSGVPAQAQSAQNAVSGSITQNQPNPQGTAPFLQAGWHGGRDPQRGPASERVNALEAWSALGSGLNEFSVSAIAISGTDIYVGGSFTQICGNLACDSGNIGVNHVAKWNGTAWSALGNGISDTVQALAVVGSDVYASGSFLEACGNAACNSGNVTVNRIAKWNGTAWVPLGQGVNNYVPTLAASGTDLYVGGGFTEICGDASCTTGNTPVNRIARWDGANWFAIGNGVNADVAAVAVNSGTVYAGGGFNMACGNAACDTGNTIVNYVAMWNTSAWVPLGNGFNASPNALAYNNGDLYAGGSISQICGNESCDSGNTGANYIAKWNGTSWSSLGNGLDAPVFSIAGDGTNVYAGGMFFNACGNAACNSGNVTMNLIARWNGSAWSALENGLDLETNALALDGSVLYAGGRFTQACGNLLCISGNKTLNRIAKYDPSGCLTAPTKPTLTSPAKNSTLTKTRPTLKWDAVPCADTYDVTVKQVGGGTVDSATDLTTTQFKTKKLAKAKTYKWFVKACNDIGCTKSKTRKFTIQ